MNLTLILFPFVVIGLSVFGFVLGIPITRVHFIVSLLLTIVISSLQFPKEKRKSILVRLCLVLGVSLILSALPVMYTVTDGANCHRPGAFLLAQGWNPVYQAEHAQLLEFANRFFDTTVFGFRDQHVMWMPKGAWIYGAVLYKTFGFVEIQDSLNVYMLLCCILVVCDFLRRFTLFPKGLCIGFALLISFSPHVVSSLFGGCCDAVVYAALACGLFSIEAFRRERRGTDLVMTILAFSLAACFKFTGLALAVVAPLIYALVMLKCKKMWGAFGAVVALVFFLNASPFITSWINHGGPFYPAHSFRAGEKPPDNMTFDFDYKNADAEKMGYWGRFAYAYLSKGLTKTYYKAMLKQKDFNPQLLLFSEIDGFGTMHRLFFVLSLIGLFWVKDRGVKILVSMLALSLFLQPGKYMGYARYVAQIYVIPPLVLIGLLMRFSDLKKWSRLIFIGVLLAYALPQMPKPLLSYPYMWLMSVQNLQVVMAVDKVSCPLIQTSSYYAAASWLYDSRKDAEVVSEIKSADKSLSYGPCSGKYQYVTKDAIPDFREFSCASVMDTSAIVDKSFSGKRRAGIEKYFFKEFLPRETVLLPWRICQVIWYRCRQFGRCWSMGDWS